MGAWRLVEAQGRCRRARSRRALPQQSGTIVVFAREGAALCGSRHYLEQALAGLGAAKEDSSRMGVVEPVASPIRHWSERNHGCSCFSRGHWADARSMIGA